MDEPREDLVLPLLERGPHASQTRVLLQVATRLHRMESILRFIQWGGTLPLGCPFCGGHEKDGHSQHCEIQHALQPGSPIGELTDTLGIAQDLIREQRRSVEMHLAMIYQTMEDSDALLARVSRLLDQA